MDIRKFLPADKEACLSLFEANQGQFFTNVDPQVFQNLLEDSHVLIFVAEHNGQLIGMTCSREASIQWLMVHPDLQRQGVGKFLTLFLLREMGKSGPLPMVSALTIASSAPFFEKLGFRLQSSEESVLQMIKKMDVCA